MTSIILFLLVYFCIQLNLLPKCILSCGKVQESFSMSFHHPKFWHMRATLEAAFTFAQLVVPSPTVLWWLAQHCTAEWWTVHLLNYLQVGFCAPLRRLGLAKVILASSSTSACKCQMQMQGDQLIRWYSNQIPLSWKQSTLKYALSWSDPRGWFYQLKYV